MADLSVAKKFEVNPLHQFDQTSSRMNPECPRWGAKKLTCDRKTVARKIRFLAEQARRKVKRWLNEQPQFEFIQWDELITFEHSRLKPLSVAVMSCSHTRTILAYGVAQIPASGQIAARSVEKYGNRTNRSASMRKRTLLEISPHLSPTATIRSDEHPRYQAEIRKVLPYVSHIQFRSKRGSLTGQGELKRIGYDPLFGINHTLAMFRDNNIPTSSWPSNSHVNQLRGYQFFNFAQAASDATLYFSQSPSVQRSRPRAA